MALYRLSRGTKGMTFLSIDIDVWQNHEPDDLARILDSLIVRLKVRGVPTVAVMNHQQMLPFVAASNARRLVNVDAHSDLTRAHDTYVINCGTWVSYVPWRAAGSYLWITCGLNPLDGDCSDLFQQMRSPQWTNGSEWSFIECRDEHVDRLPRGILNGVVEAGLCMSPAFCGTDHDRVFKRAVKLHQVPYVKGRRSEQHDRYLGTQQKLPVDLYRPASTRQPASRPLDAC